MLEIYLKALSTEGSDSLQVSEPTYETLVGHEFGNANS